MNSDVRDRLIRCPDLPTLPRVAVQILDQCQDEDPDIRLIAQTIASDPALAARILRLTNSPLHGLRTEVRTVSHAVSLLGLNAVRTVALSFTLVHELRRREQTGLVAYWKRSLLSAVAARELARLISFPHGEEAFLAALLQDLGILVLRRVFPEAYDAAVEDAGDDHERLAECERAVFGGDHAEVGAWLCQRWELPASLATAVSRSHMPAALGPDVHADVQTLARLVAVGAAIADIWVRADTPAASEAARKSATELLRLDAPALELALSRTAENIQTVSALFDVDIGTAEKVNGILDRAKEVLVLLALRTTREMRHAQEALSSMHARARRAEEESQRDPLTALANRARFDAYYSEMFGVAMSLGVPLSVVLIDIDRFKRVNDTRGHAAGDKVLVTAARLLGARLRPRDLAARYGGEEFVLVLPETDARGAAVVAERVRANVEAAEVALDSGPLHVTVSLGHATLFPALFKSKEALLRAADVALYAAKNAGRNRVIDAQTLPSNDEGLPSPLARSVQPDAG